MVIFAARSNVGLYVHNLPMALSIPNSLAVACRQSKERIAWLQELPAVVHRLQQQWGFVPGPPYENASCAWVAPVELADGTSAVVKIGIPHMEAEDEADGLHFWEGDPTVRLIKADKELHALLLERCEPGISLSTRPESEQNQVIANLLNRLWRLPSALHRFRPLSAMLDYWSIETMEDAQRWPDAKLVLEGLRLFAELPTTTPRKALLATDLHAGNVLRAEREPWLVIDPKPFVGDPAYDATQHIFNCRASLQADTDGTIQRFADLLDVDQERVRLWVFARAAAEPRTDWANSDLFAVARKIKL